MKSPRFCLMARKLFGRGAFQFPLNAYNGNKESDGCNELIACKLQDKKGVKEFCIYSIFVTVVV